MLDALIKTMDHGVSYGSGALKALQNDSLPELDLLVREAIQNSSDAALGVEGDSFEVNFNVGKFVPREFNLFLSKAGEILNRKYTDESAEYMEIRDLRTSGLTGPVRLSELDREDHGNYFKLVFDTGKEQTASDAGEAGGSWGYGKSVYYRVGIGLVIFYSQIKNSTGSEERLIISLTEHEDGDNSILNEVCSDSVGRAWWGKKDLMDEKELLPLTDAEEIEEILNVFGVQRFSEGETGTSIIIPYVCSERLLDGIFPDDCGVPEETKAMCSWKDNVSEYIELAVQKWYAPKIFNKNLPKCYGQKWLAVRIDGNGMKNTKMRLFFRLIQDLYTTAICANAGEKYISECFTGIESVAIPSQKIEGQKSGHAAFVRVNRSQLSETGSMLDPYTYLRIFTKSPQNDPIVMFARKPGLVLDYKTDGKWAKGLVKPEDENEYLVVFYVPNFDVILKNEKGFGEYAGASFGEYLRKCEKSDHMEWEDKSNMTIVANIKNQVVSKVNNHMKEGESETVEGTASKLAGKLGRRLLPVIGYGKNAGGKGGTGTGGGSSVSDNLSIELTPIIRRDCVEVQFILTFKNMRKDAAVGIFIETETGVMDAKAWVDDIGTKFPVSIESIKSCYTAQTGTSEPIRFLEDCTENVPIIRNDLSEIELLYTENGTDIRGFKVRNEITCAIVFGTMVIKTTDRKCVCTIREIKNS